jgi:hypothetical protein
MKVCIFTMNSVVFGVSARQSRTVGAKNGVLGGFYLETVEK